MIRMESRNIKITSIFSFMDTCFSIWDRKRCSKLSSFKNRSLLEHNTLTTSMKFINESTNTILITGSEDGVIRAWANIDHEPKMLTSWRALQGLTGTKGSSLLLDFNQDTGILVKKDRIN